MLFRSVHARHLYPIWVDAALRDKMVKGLQERGIQTVVNYRAIHQMSYLRERLGYKDGTFPIAESIGDRTLSLPFYPGMPDEYVDIVCEAMEEIAAREP